MKAHGFDMRGTFKGELVPTLPAWQSSDEGREIYVEDENKKYYGNDTEWVDYSIAESATETDSYLVNVPFENILTDNGRFSGTSIGLARDVTSFTAPGFFAPYNSGSIAENGQFIYNNNDYGGSAGAMTQTTIDLLETMGRVSSWGRYGTEFFIAGLTAGSGTAASASFPGGTRYLMSTNGAISISGTSGYCTFCSWVRAINGSIGLGGAACQRFEIDGVVQSNANYDLATSANWVFVLMCFSFPHGYDTGTPRFYGNNGNKIQIALPGMFRGYLKNIDPYTAPIVSRV